MRKEFVDLKYLEGRTWLSEETEGSDDIFE